MNYTVYYLGMAGWRPIAQFKFLQEAEQYIRLLHPNDAEIYRVRQVVRPDLETFYDTHRRRKRA